MRRWLCPNCGSGVNAPERPRKNDVRRFCLKCSAATGYLVERTSPALERRRAAADALRQGKVQKERERARERLTVIAVDALLYKHKVDVRLETHRALRDMGYRRASDITVTIHRGNKTYVTGRAFWYEDRIHYTVPTGRCPHEALLELIYHEAAHIVNRTVHGAQASSHGEQYRRILADGLQKRWPFIRYGSLRAGGAYPADHRVVEQMKQYVLTGGVL